MLISISFNKDGIPSISAAQNPASSTSKSNSESVNKKPQPLHLREGKDGKQSWRLHCGVWKSKTKRQADL